MTPPDRRGVGAVVLDVNAPSDQVGAVHGRWRLARACGPQLARNHPRHHSRHHPRHHPMCDLDAASDQGGCRAGGRSPRWGITFGRDLADRLRPAPGRCRQGCAGPAASRCGQGGRRRRAKGPQARRHACGVSHASGAPCKTAPSSRLHTRARRAARAEVRPCPGRRLCSAPESPTLRLDRARLSRHPSLKLLVHGEKSTCRSNVSFLR